jgi:predicted GH43/DUF377 family glycosyl hydrolase
MHTAACCVLMLALSLGDEGQVGPPLELVLEGGLETELAPHGRGNVYAPEVHFDQGRYRMWYGGQGRDSHDRIHLAESTDGKSWTRYGVQLENQGGVHVNDPSVVRVGSAYYMYFTQVDRGIVEEIGLATSRDGYRWVPLGVVLRPGAPGEWDSLLIGRPAVLHVNGQFMMWYDGRKDMPPGRLPRGVPTSTRSRLSLGLATSPDGVNWTKHPGNPVVERTTGAVDVKRSGDQFLMVYQSSKGTSLATSPDGVSWADRGLWMPISGQAIDRFGHATPMLLPAEGARPLELFVGAARAASWDQNVIARFVLDPALMERRADPAPPKP